MGAGGRLHSLGRPGIKGIDLAPGSRHSSRAYDRVQVRPPGRQPATKGTGHGKPSGVTMTDFAVGDILASKYEIKAILGAGGMGTVYRARQLDLGRDVAIKVPRPEALEVPGFLARFTREARTVAKLMHDNIVQVYEYQEAADNLVYIVMEFVEGQDLKYLVGKPPSNLTIGDMATILRGACEGLAHAHEFGIVHRDIKPHNIMVQQRAKGKWRVKIMDFGIAHLEANSNVTMQQEQLTVTGQAIGTPSYMSPEQIRGSGVSAKSDIYSMGCVIYFCFTRNTPFQGSGFTVAAAHLSEPPPSIRQRLPMMPEALDRIITQCLEKDPAARPADCSDLGQAVFECLRPLFDIPMSQVWTSQSEQLADTDLIRPTVPVGGELTKGATLTDGGPEGATMVDSAGATNATRAATEIAPSYQLPPSGPPLRTSMASQADNRREMTGTEAAVTGSTKAYAGPAGQPVDAAPAPAPAPAPAGRNPLLIGAAVLVPLLLVGTGVGIMMGGGKKKPATIDPVATPTPAVQPTAPPPEVAATPVAVVPGTPAVDSPLATPAATPAVTRPTATPEVPARTPAPTPDPILSQINRQEQQFARATTLAGRAGIWQTVVSLASETPDPRLNELADRFALEIAKAPEMALVTSGNFTMGARDGSPNPEETPAHNVQLSRYYIGRFEVTALELSVYLNTLDPAVARRRYRVSDQTTITFDESRGRFVPRADMAMHPANGVTWDLANDYALWLSEQTGRIYRLPTEAEWERAAAGTQGNTYPWGDNEPESRRAVFNSAPLEPVFGRPDGETPVTRIQHLAGNVAEWCGDWYDEEYYRRSESVDPKGPIAKPSGRARRVVRGGSHLSPPTQLRTRARGREEPDNNHPSLGFRLVREADD